MAASPPRSATRSASASARCDACAGARASGFPTSRTRSARGARSAIAQPPAGFGFIAPSWQPRRGHAGTYDEAWAATRAPFLPRDFDPRFANAASAGLTFDEGLRGGEPIALDGVSREGPLRSVVPALRPRVEVIAAGKREAPPVQLETLLLEPDERRMSLTWRAALRCDKRALKLERIHIREEAAPSCRARSS